MQIPSQENSFNVKPRLIAAVALLIISIIVSTPLCGMLFKCGCDWPWYGLDKGCNIHKPAAIHQCPWCVSLSTGIFSIAIAIVGGILAAIALPLFCTKHQTVKEIALRTLFGISIFLLLTILAAVLAALWQGYPH